MEGKDENIREDELKSYPIEYWPSNQRARQEARACNKCSCNNNNQDNRMYPEFAIIRKKSSAMIPYSNSQPIDDFWRVKHH